MSSSASAEGRRGLLERLDTGYHCGPARPGYSQAHALAQPLPLIGALNDAMESPNLRARHPTRQRRWWQTSAARQEKLMQAILRGRAPIADIVNAKIISLEDAAQGCESFDQGAAVKYVLDPHDEIPVAA